MSQSGVTISEGGAPFIVVKDLSRSSPGAKQALVKSAYVSLNPVDTIMQKYGTLIHDWPAVIGSDFCAQVIETGPECTKVKKGDYVYGVCRIGQKAYSPFQETFLVDEDLVFKVEGALTPAQASTIAVGTITSAFGIIVGAKVPLPAPGTKVPERDEWLIVLGGSGTVGHYAIQIGRLCGYKVAASCSASHKSIAMGFGAQAAINNRATPDEQAAEVKSITGGKYSIVFDASGLSHEAAAKMLEATTASPKYYTTVESNQHDMPAGVTSYYVLIAKLGQDDELGKQVTEETKKMIPSLQAHVVSGALAPLEPEVYSGTGFESLVKALGDFGEGKTKGKVVVRLQEE
ncbi:oxidoreductase, zinc-binding dehydrogenase family superfamily [Metarhizium guizhouense ARSEF 977]|uniref:Oxidoreductase, zinc-binding dehydrogenase family superfamily n=1 Tax=Metarhizium guizhouense (strain ARSEF 977) TaxID=1276136 RepID=A0A0B4HPF7_METGA|nr:oxidoreductase, zinc-binding dehydrogenase family superfamily [Metarhizium guizhouense ARSEF 977]